MYMSPYFAKARPTMVKHLSSSNYLWHAHNCDIVIYYKVIYCILRGQIKGFNSSITTIMCQGGSYRTVVG